MKEKHHLSFDFGIGKWCLSNQSSFKVLGTHDAVMASLRQVGVVDGDLSIRDEYVVECENMRPLRVGLLPDGVAGRIVWCV